MYLSRLGKKEKENFLELAYYAANYNEILSDEEKTLIEEYRKEMLLTENDYEIKDKDINQLLDFFNNRTQTTKNIVFLEILSLLLSDTIYDEEEKKFISLLQDSLNISEKNHDKIINWVYEIQELYSWSENFIKNKH